MKRLLVALIAAVFSLTAIAPAVAAERPDKTRMQADKKDKKKGDRKGGQGAAPKAGWDIKDNKKM